MQILPVNYSNSKNKTLTFKAKANQVFISEAETIIKKLENNPAELAKFFLKKGQHGSIYTTGLIGTDLVKIHDALKNQPDVLFQMYTTPVYNQYTGKKDGPFYFQDELSRRIISRNVLDLALNTDLSAKKSKILLDIYNYAAKGTEFEKDFNIYLAKFKELDKKNVYTDEPYLCAPGVEKHLITLKEIKNQWSNPHFTFDDV